jgi:hypothetical protein
VLALTAIDVPILFMPMKESSMLLFMLHGSADFNRWRERGVGAIMLVSFAAASLGGLFATFGKKIWALMTG